MNDTNTAASSSSLEATVTAKTLETTPERALRLLRAVAKEPTIRGMLGEYGWSHEEHAEGWRLLHEASGFQTAPADRDVSDEAVRAAIAALDAVDDKIVRVLTAALSRRYPEHAELLLTGVKPGRGIAAVLALDVLLDRIDTLVARAAANGPASADQAVLALIERRALPPAERARLRSLLTTAKRSHPVVEQPGDRDVEQQAYEQTLIRLRDWYEEWAEIAHVAIKRRDLLVRMGLAKQQRSG